MDGDKHEEKWNAQLLPQERLRVQEDTIIFVFPQNDSVCVKNHEY